MDKHKQQYASMRNPSHNSSLWKNTLKERCMARMKGARGDSLKKAREDGSLATRVRDLMADEVRQLKSAREFNGFIDTNAPDMQGDDYINLMRLLEEELMDELKQQEALLIAQYEDVRRLEEQELQETVARYREAEADGETGAIVPCPICMQSKLIQNKQVIFCACGFRMDLKDPSISLENLQEQLFNSFANHNKQCSATPKFEVQDQFGISALYLKCSVCDSFDVVI